MCCEYEQDGVNDFERNSNGFAQLYNNIQKHKRYDIEIVKDFKKFDKKFQ